MPNPYGAPEVSVQQVSQKLAEQKNEGGQQFVWLDVRETNEHALVSITNADVQLIPLSQLATQGIAALPLAAQDKSSEIIVNCHHGMRSAQVVAWLKQQGWHNVYNLAGGIDAWARQIDPSIGTY